MRRELPPVQPALPRLIETKYPKQTSPCGWSECLVTRQTPDAREPHLSGGCVQGLIREPPGGRIAIEQRADFYNRNHSRTDRPIRVAATSVYRRQ